MALRADGALTEAPSIEIVPRVAGSSPCKMRNSVVLPQPLGPITETNSPVPTSNEILRKTSRAPRPRPSKVLHRSCTCSMLGISGYDFASAEGQHRGGLFRSAILAAGLRPI